MHRQAVVLFASLASCGPTSLGRSNGGPVTSTAGPCRNSSGASTNRAGVPPAVPLLQQIQAFEQRFAAHDARYLGVVASGFIAAGANITTAIDVPSNECISILAVASSGISDLDAHVFAPHGQLVAQDVAEDAHPVVQLCATDARRVFHVIEAYRGQGAYAVATFATDRRGAEAIARMLRDSGGAPGTALAGSGTPSGAEGRLSVLRDGIARRGFTVDGDVQHANFRAAGSLRFGVRVSPEHCYTFAAFADDHIRDVDLSVRDAEDAEIARDIRGDRDAVVQVCPAIAGTLSVDVRAVGVGEVLLQTFGADAAAMAGANTLWLGERLEWSAMATPLAESVETVRRVMASLGYASTAAPVNTVLAPGESRDSRVTLEPGRCTAMLAIEGRGLGALGVRVVGATGELLARGHGNGPASAAVVCAAAREVASLRVRADAGSGEAATWTFALATPPTWQAGLDPVLVSEVLSEQIAQALAGWRMDGTPERIRIGARAVRGRDVTLGATTCQRWAVSTGRGLPGVALTYRTPTGAALHEVVRSGTATLSHCAAAQESARVDIELDDDVASEFDALFARYSRIDRPRGAR